MTPTTGHPMDLTNLLAINDHKLLTSMAVIPIGAVEKTPVIVLRSILAKVTSGSTNRLRKGEAVDLWRSVVSDYQMNLTAVITTESDTRAALNPVAMGRIASLPYEAKVIKLSANLRGLALSSIKNELTWLRKFLNATADYPDRQELIYWSYEHGKGISMAVNTATKVNLRKRLEDVQEISYSNLESWINKRLESNNYLDIAIIIAICTGRRMVEILGNKSSYAVSETPGEILFTGPAKKKGGFDSDAVFSIPCHFIEPSKLVELVERLEELGKRIEVLSDKTINLAYAKQISRAAKPIAKFKDARDIYVAVALYRKLNGKCQAIVYASRILAHDVQADGTSTSAISYQKFTVVP